MALRRSAATSGLLISAALACGAERQSAPTAVHIENAPASRGAPSPPKPVELLADGSLRVRAPGRVHVLLSAPLAPCPFDSTAIPFRYFVEACPELEPSLARPISSSPTESELRQRYFATAQCVLDHFRAKPYWEPEVLSSVDVCENTLGKPWRMLGPKDALAFASVDTELQQAVPSDPRGWYFAGFVSYARTPQEGLGTLHIGKSRSVSPFHIQGRSGRHEDNRLGLRCVRPDTLQSVATRPVPDEARACGQMLRGYMTKKTEPPKPDPTFLQKPPPPAIVQFQSYTSGLASESRPVDVKRARADHFPLPRTLLSARHPAVDVKRAKAELLRIEPIARELKQRLPSAYAVRKQILFQIQRMDPGSMTAEQRRELPRVLEALRSAGSEAPPESHLAQRDWDSLYAALAALSGYIAQEHRMLGRTHGLCQQLELVDAGHASKVAPEKVQHWRREVKQSPVACSKIGPRQTELSAVSVEIRRLMDTSPQALLPSSLIGASAAP